MLLKALKPLKMGFSAQRLTALSLDGKQHITPPLKSSGSQDSGQRLSALDIANPQLVGLELSSLDHSKRGSAIGPLWRLLLWSQSVVSHLQLSTVSLLHAQLLLPSLTFSRLLSFSGAL